MMIAVEWQEVVALFAIGATIAGIWWRLQQQITANARALDVYKLEAAEKYASITHLKDVESRLIVSIDRLSDRIDRLLSKIERDIE